VGDTAGQVADGFHPLGPQVLRLNFALFGHVSIYHQNGFRLILGIQHQRPATLDQKLSFFPVILMQIAEPLSRGHNPFIRLSMAAEIQTTDVSERTPQRFLFPPTVEAFRTAVPVSDPQVEITHENGILRPVEEGCLFAQACFGFKALGQIGNASNQSQENAFGIPDRKATVENKCIQSVCPAKTVLSAPVYIRRLEQCH